MLDSELTSLLSELPARCVCPRSPLPLLEYFLCGTAYWWRRQERKEEEKEGYSKLAVNELEPVTLMFATVPV